MRRRGSCEALAAKDKGVDGRLVFVRGGDEGGTGSGSISSREEPKDHLASSSADADAEAEEEHSVSTGDWLVETMSSA